LVDHGKEVIDHFNLAATVAGELLDFEVFHLYCHVFISFCCAPPR
jgi:hypothetical protein